MGRGVVDTGLMSVGNPLPKFSLDLDFCHFSEDFYMNKRNPLFYAKNKSV